MEQSTAAANTSGALHVIRGIFGFLLSALLIILLVFNGFVLPAKTTFIKGDTVNEILENLDLHEVIYEIAGELFDKNYSEFGISRELYETFFTEDNIKEICDTSITAIMNDEDIDLSFLKDDVINKLKSEVNTTINSAFDEIAAADHKVIDANVLASNTALINFKNAYGVDVSGVIMSAISSQYGIESIDLNYIDINAVKGFVSESVETTVYPEIENTISKTISNASVTVNTELDKMLDGRSIKSDIILFETSVAGFKLLIIAILTVIAVIMIIQLIMYHSCLYRAFRNFSISALFPGLLITGMGFISSMALPIALEEVAAEINNTTFTEFVERLITPFFDSFTMTGLIYLAAFAVFLILSVILKIAHKKRNTIYY